MPRQFGVPEKVIKRVIHKLDPPSVYSEYMKQIHDHHVIGINNAYQLGTWIDVLFFGDVGWYLTHQRRLQNWPGIKASCAPTFANKKKQKLYGVKFTPKNRKKKMGISDTIKSVSWNKNSGAAAISLASHFGVKRICLLGFDMGKSEIAGMHVTHYHGSHGTGPIRYANNKKPIKEPYGRHLVGFHQIARDAKKMGIEILNVSDISAINQFPKVTLDEALNG